MCYFANKKGVIVFLFLLVFFLTSQMLSSIEKEGGAEKGQKMIFFKKGGIEWRSPAHCKYLILVILSDQWLNASFIFTSISRS